MNPVFFLSMFFTLGYKCDDPVWVADRRRRHRRLRQKLSHLVHSRRRSQGQGGGQKKRNGRLRSSDCLVRDLLEIFEFG